MQYIKFVTTSPTEQTTTAVSPGTPVKTSSVASGSNIVFSEIKVRKHCLLSIALVSSRSRDQFGHSALLLGTQIF